MPKVLKAEGWNWYIAMSAAFLWLKQLARPAQIQGAENSQSCSHIAKCGEQRR